MRLHEEICELEGMKENCWEDLEQPILTIVEQTADELYSDAVSLESSDDELYGKLDDIFVEIAQAVEDDPNLDEHFNDIDDNDLDDVIRNAAAGLIGGLTDGDNWGMAEDVGGEFQSCIDSLIEEEDMEIGDAAAECLEYSSSAFSAEFGLGNKNN